jgi:general secretion pathway protein D
VAANPGNSEYRLHYRRALFNASQMLFMRGRVFAEQKNYVAAYNAFRQAYGYDPTNELAKAEMERMVRLQKEAEDPNDPNKPDPLPSTNPTGVKVVPTSYNPAAVQDPPQVEQLRDIKFTRVPLKDVIQNLARDLDLNVLFDAESFGRQGGQPRELTIELTGVTTAAALDAIFLQEGLFFQRVGKRMIIVANGQTQRQKFQQLVLRTFYLSNADPEKVKTVLQSAIPAQPGRPPTVPIVDKDTNSITVRDTAENIKIIGNLIKALDKDRAEVVMDVNIYEVSKSDLLQLGAQIGDENSLINLGGSSSGLVEVGRIRNNVYGSTVNSAGKIVNNLSRSIGAGVLLPEVQIKALQGKGNTRLLASTQVHAFNNEESQARIGQRVPVRTAQLLGFNNQPGQPNTGGNGFNNAADVINYEQVGLTLKFTPIVFPNQDVQVKMSIESKDVVTTGLTPTFSERTISGTARIQNNRTLLLASVAQDSQTNTKVGLPLLGLIPIFGRLFTAPERSNRQVDIVIAVTPRVLRAPSILPEDEVERPTGSIAVPTNSSLADMIRQEDFEDRLAAARRQPNVAVVQLPDQKPEEVAPGYVPASGQQTTVNTAAVSAPTNTLAPDVTPKPIDSSVKTLNIAPTSEKINEPQTEQPPLANSQSEAVNAELRVAPLGALKAGEKRRVAVMVKSPLALRLAVLSLGFDAAKIKINRMLYGEVFGAGMANKEMTSFAASNGNLMATFPTAPNSNAQGVGVLAYIEIEALADSDNAAFQINNTVSSLIGYSGETLTLNK